MMAEGIHSAVDTGNEVLLLIGEKNAARPPDAKHPFGYGKVVYFWALIVALSVFSLGGGLSIYHGVHGLLDPGADRRIRCGATSCSASRSLFEGYSWNLSRLGLNKYRKDGDNLWQAVRASKDAAVFTVFIEDSAALLGVVVAALGIGLGQLFDNPLFDPAASVVIGLLLVGAAFTLARETGALLVGESIGPRGDRRTARDHLRRSVDRQGGTGAEHADGAGRSAADGGGAVQARHEDRRGRTRHRAPRAGGARAQSGGAHAVFRIGGAALVVALRRARPLGLDRRQRAKRLRLRSQFAHQRVRQAAACASITSLSGGACWPHVAQQLRLGDVADLHRRR